MHAPLLALHNYRLQMDVQKVWKEEMGSAAPHLLSALTSYSKQTRGWHALNLHNCILISSLLPINLVAIVRAAIRSAAVQAAGNKVNRQGQKSVQMFPGNKMFLSVESSNSIPVAF